MIKSITNWNQLVAGTRYEKEVNLTEINRFDFGGILGLGVSYPISDKITVFFDCTSYYGFTDFWNEEFGRYVEENFGTDVNRISKNRIYRTVLGLTYKIKTID